MCLDNDICGPTDSVVVELFDDSKKSIVWSKITSILITRVTPSYNDIEKFGNL